MGQEWGPSRKRGMKGCWHRLGSLCHEDTAGFEVAWVGEAVGGAPEHLEQVVCGSRDSAVGGPVGVVPGEDLVGPGDDGVDYAKSRETERVHSERAKVYGQLLEPFSAIFGMKAPNASDPVKIIQSKEYRDAHVPRQPGWLR